MGHVHDAERLLTPPDAEDLLLRVAAQQTVSPLSMDAVYDPPPLLKLRERAVGTEKGRAMTYTTVLLRAMCASDEPSLEPHESIQWVAYVVVRVLARLARAHPSPEVFEPVLEAMHAVQAERLLRGDASSRDFGGAGPRYPMRFALGWLLLAELRDETRAGGDQTRVSRWAKRLASRMSDAAEGDGDDERNADFEFSRELFGAVRVAGDVSASRRALFGLPESAVGKPIDRETRETKREDEEKTREEGSARDVRERG
jgi:hypothetical protein